MAVFLRHLAGNGNHCFSKIVSTSTQELIVTSLQVPFPDIEHKVVGYCNGLFCLEYVDDGILLWNPSMDEIQRLPSPPPALEFPSCPNLNCDRTCTVHSLSVFCGLGFDPKTGDYKVVRLVTYFYDHHGVVKRYQVYSLQNDHWKDTPEGGVDTEEIDIINECAFYLDGFCYWVAEEKVKDLGLCMGILCFDLGTEMFSIISVPVVYRQQRHEFILMEFMGALHVAVYLKYDLRKHVHHWGVSPGREWGKIEYEVEAERLLGRCDDLLLLDGLNFKLLAQDFAKDKLKEFSHIHDHPHTMQLFPYFMSNLSLKSPSFASSRKRKALEE